MTQSELDKANDLMFPGSPGFEAAHQNFANAAVVLFFAALAIGYWLGRQGPDPEGKHKTRNLIIMGILVIVAGVFMSMPGGIFATGWGGVCFGVGLFIGNRQYKKSLEK